jgi:hypothetical protein
MCLNIYSLLQLICISNKRDKVIFEHVLKYRPTFSAIDCHSNVITLLYQIESLETKDKRQFKHVLKYRLPLRFRTISV